MATCFSVSTYTVKEGERDEFVERWTTLIDWTRETQEGLEFARLLSGGEDPLVFVSVGEWRDSAARKAWMEEPRCLELSLPAWEVCNDVQGSEYEIRVAV